MRKVVVSMYVTLDGFIAGPNGELDWIFKVSDEELDKYSDDLLDTVEVILLGRDLFKNIKERINLKFVKTRTFNSGVVGLYYIKGTKA